ncbi:MAG: hypothetical protein Q9217_006655 [Psora testacea]
MHYIRFLKPPRFYTNGSQTSVKALVTVTTDLGDDFFHAELKLEVALLGQSNSTFERKTIGWKPSMRAVWVEITAVSPTLIRDTPSLLVSSRRSTKADEIRMRHFPEVLSACTRVTSSGEAFGVGRLERKLRTRSTELCIFEEMGESISRHIWDAATALIAYLDQTAQAKCKQNDSLDPSTSSFASLLEMRHKCGLRILELGSGCGIVGIWMATSFPNTQVVLTDLPEAMEILGINVNHARVAMGSRLEKAVLDWDEELPEDIVTRTFDLIIVSDCTYNCDSVPALVKTLATLIGQSFRALIVVSMKIRHESELVFFDLISEAGLAKLGKASVPFFSAHEMATQQPGEAADVYVFGRSKR